MDDFDGEEYDYIPEQYEEDDDDRSLKEKYDDAKETYDDLKDKYDKVKDKYDKYKNNSNPQTDSKQLNNKLRSGNKAGNEVAKQGGKEAGKQAGKEAAKQGGKEAAKQAGKEVAKQAGKETAKQGAKVAVEGAVSATGVGVVVAAAIEAADRLNKIKKKIDKKADAAIEDTTGIKNFSKKRKWLLPLLVIAIFMLFGTFTAIAMYSVSETATSDLKTLVKAREETNKKELILFTKSELNDLLKKDITLSDDVIKKLTDDGFDVDESKKSYSYKSIMKGYGSDMRDIFYTTNLDKLSDSLKEDISDDTDTTEGEKVSLAQVKKYLMCEINNFNKVKWKTTVLSADYGISGERKSKKYTGDNAYNSYLNDANKVTGISGNMSSSSVSADYTVKDESGNNTMLKTPKFKDLGTQGGNNEMALQYVKMLSPYMQKWIIPYTIMIDTQDEEFVNSVIDNMYHPVDVSLFQLKKLVKEVTFEYYMECLKSIKTQTVYEGDSTIVDDVKIQGAPVVTNTKEATPGERRTSRELIKEEDVNGKKVKVYKETYEIVMLSATNTIAKDASGNPMVKSVKITRKLENAETLPEITYIGAFYEIIEKSFEILPINEADSPNESSMGDISVNDKSGIGTQILTESWKENIVMQDSKTTKYEVSYITPEELKSLGRSISRIEWYQDFFGMLSGVNTSGAMGSGSNKFEQAYNGSYKEVINRVWDGMISWGYTKEQAAAVLGNMAQESSYNPYVVNSIGASGLCQWLNGRFNQLIAFARDKGTNWTDVTTQIQFVCMETSWTEKYQFASYQWAGHQASLDKFKSGSVEEAAVAFRRGWERCGEAEANDPVRITCAKAAYETLKDRDTENIEYPIEKVQASSSISSDGNVGGKGTSSGVKYSYEDMEFAFYQIEEWYKNSGSDVSAITITDGEIYIPSSTSKMMNKTERDALMADLFDGKSSMAYSTTQAEIEKYIVTIDIPIINQYGKETTMKLRVHKKVAATMVQIFTEIKAGGFKIRTSDTGAYNWRGGQKIGSGSLYSMHCLGLAVDVNWDSNAYYVNGKLTTGRNYSPGVDPFSMPANGIAVQTFKKYGWKWGGDWNSTKDYMHFSITGN